MLLLLDVDVDAVPANDLFPSAPLRVPPNQKPAITPSRASHPRLHFETGPGSARGFPGLRKQRDIFGMKDAGECYVHQIVRVQAKVVDQVSIEVFDAAVRIGSPDLLRNGFRQFAKLAFSLDDF